MEWLKNLFSVNTASRFVTVIIGIALVIVALVILASASKTVQETVKTAAIAA
jgi:hypothetical protein